MWSVALKSWPTKHQIRAKDGEGSPFTAESSSLYVALSAPSFQAAILAEAYKNAGRAASPNSIPRALQPQSAQAY